MSQNQQSGKQSKDQQNLSPQLVEQILENQKIHLQNKNRELDLKEKELDLNAKLAERQMVLQADLLKDKPSQKRKNIITRASVAIVIVSIFLAFFLYCLTIGKEDFAWKVFGGLMYVVTTIVGYYFGKNSTTTEQKETEQLIQDIDYNEE